MASVTHPNVAFPLCSSTVRVEPPRGLLGLRFGEVWAYRELLYFFRLARRQDPLQTNCHWHPLRRLATRPHHSLRNAVLNVASPVAYPASLLPSRFRWLYGFKP
jgi:hypothetical protein